MNILLLKHKSYGARHWLFGVLIATMLNACSGSSDDSNENESSEVITETPIVEIINGAIDGTIIDALSIYGDTDTFLSALTDAGLTDILSDENNSFTVFAPTNTAFEALGDITGLSESELRSFLLYHILADDVYAADMLTEIGELAFAENNQAITFQIDDDGNLYVNDSQIIVSDIETYNGVVHVLSNVIKPEEFLWSSFELEEDVAHELVPSALFDEIGGDNFVRYFYSRSLGDSATALAGEGNISGSWHAVTDSVYPYQIWLPDTLSENMPVTLLLHTRGEQGDDNIRQIETDHAVTWASSVEEATILIAPQAAAGTAAWSATDLDILLGSALDGYTVDEDRFYVSGHSFGGRGVLNLLNSSAHKFAAAALFAPSGSDYDSLDIDTLNDTPQWYIVSEADRIVDHAVVSAFYQILTAE